MEKIIKDLSKKQGKSFSLEDEFKKIEENKDTVNDLMNKKKNEEQRKIKEAEDNRQKAKRKKAFENIPKKFEGVTMQNLKDEYEGKEFYQALNVFVKAVYDIDELDKGIYLYGNTGTGKTSLLSVLAQVLYDKKGKSISYMTEEEFKNSLQETYKDYSNKTDVEVIKDIAKHEIVLIDELGQNNSKWFLQNFKILLDEIQNKKHLIFTTSNYSLEKLAGRYMEKNPTDELCKQVVDRLIGMTTPLEIKGESRR